MLLFFRSPRVAGLPTCRQQQLLPLRQATVEPGGRPQPEIQILVRVRRCNEQVCHDNEYKFYNYS
jgi:hypothetical protein